MKLLDARERVTKSGRDSQEQSKTSTWIEDLCEDAFLETGI